MWPGLDSGTTKSSPAGWLRSGSWADGQDNLGKVVHIVKLGSISKVSRVTAENMRALLSSVMKMRLLSLFTLGSEFENQVINIAY